MGQKFNINIWTVKSIVIADTVNLIMQFENFS